VFCICLETLLMNHLRGGLIAGLSVGLLVACIPAAEATSAGDADGTPTLLTELQFSAASPMISSTAGIQSFLSKAAIGVPGWVIGAQNGGSVAVPVTTGPDGTTAEAALEGIYPTEPASGGYNMWADYSVKNLNTEDIYIEFWAKMPAAMGGCKFLKIFGDIASTSGFANATFGTDYTGIQSGAILQVTFGDGSGLKNDGQNVIKLDGSHPDMIGRSYGTAVVKTPQMSGFSAAEWGSNWHHFLVHVKFNSGTTAQNQVPDGEFFLEIDGKVYVDATDLYNRNPANGPIQEVELFGWAQNDPQPFQVWYDDIRISTGGFVSQPLPNPPSDVRVNVSGPE
jgi:hypothetical protein